MVSTALAMAMLAIVQGEPVASVIPNFERFPSPVVRIERRPPVKLVSARDRLSRSVLTSAVADEVNFAGHWVLTEIGCGASCIQVAAVDKLGGRVVWFPGTICCWPLAVSEPLGYRRDSRLLVVHGGLNETGPASMRAFVFDGRRFDLLGR